MSAVFGIGNPLIDVVFSATEEDLRALKLDKGIMHLVTEERQQEILHHFSGKTPQLQPGGSAPNTLLALAGLGVTAVISGKIGNDEFGNTYDAQVSAYGITSRLVHGDGATGSSIILVTPDGERTMNTHLGMCREFDVADLDEELLRTTVRDGGFLYFTGYMWDTETQKGAIRRAITITHEENGRVVFDLADPFAVERYRDDFLELLRDEIDVVFANLREAQILLGYDDGTDRGGDTGNNDPDRGLTPGGPEGAAGATGRVLARRLAAMVPTVALKTGKEGSLVAHRPDTRHRPDARHPERSPAADRSPATAPEPVIETVSARPITPRDTTGAGDMYAAGFLAGLVRGDSPRRCGEIAGILAEEIIQQVGAQFEVERIRTLSSELRPSSGRGDTGR